MDVVVSGGSSGIGQSIVEKFARHGARVFVISRTYPSQPSHGVVHIPADLGLWAEGARVASEIRRFTPKVDVLVNNVGRSDWRPLSECDLNFVNELFDLNVKSYISLSQAILPLIVPGGAVVNVSSIAGKRGSKNNGIYCATKFAVNGLTQAWAKELGESNAIRVNAVCPVLVDTDGLRQALKGRFSPANGASVDDFLSSFTSSNSALSRLPALEEVSELVHWLSSDCASGITGQCINVDCGVFPQ